MHGDHLWELICKSVTPIDNLRQSKRKYLRKIHVSPVIDLHGYTIQAAWRRVRTFIEESPHQHITVITGNGQIATEIETWFSQCSRVRYYTVCNGGGAFKLVLKMRS